MRVPLSPPRAMDNIVGEMPIYEWWEKCRRVRKEGGGIVFIGVTTHSIKNGTLMSAVLYIMKDLYMELIALSYS